jgi:hypothetical protein
MATLWQMVRARSGEEFALDVPEVLESSAHHGGALHPPPRGAAPPPLPFIGVHRATVGHPE